MSPATVQHGDVTVSVYESDGQIVASFYRYPIVERETIERDRMRALQMTTDEALTRALRLLAA